MTVEFTNTGKLVRQIEQVSLKDEKILKASLEKNLEQEITCNDFLDDTGLFDTPIVDSKSVMKLSPIVERHVGIKIKPEWIKCGGYDSVKEAVSHLINQIKKSIVSGEVSCDV